MAKVDIKYKKEKLPQNYYVNVTRVISYALMLTGIGIIGYTLFPIATQYIKVIAQPQEQAAPEPIINLISYEQDISYVASVINKAKEINETNVSKLKQVVDTSYSSPMYINIPDIGIENIKVTPNIESSSEDFYKSALKSGVAHFKYTPLPGAEGEEGNSFIYGHSGTDGYFNQNPNNPEVIFTKLKNIKVGTKVSIQKDNETFEYSVIREKIVDPSDLSVLDGIAGKETITLMTCYPWGVGTHRFIVIAERIK